MKTHTLNSFVLALASAACWWPCAGQAVTPTEYELGEAARWTAAKFKAATDTGKPGAGLYVLANNDPVQLTAILVAILVGPRHSGPFWAILVGPRESISAILVGPRESISPEAVGSISDLRETLWVDFRASKSRYGVLGPLGP
jgi:hypothetical protein